MRTASLLTLHLAVAAALPAISATASPGSDIAVSQSLAERLRAALGKPDNRIETYEGVVTLRGVGIKVETRAGIAPFPAACRRLSLSGAPARSRLRCLG